MQADPDSTVTHTCRERGVWQILLWPLKLCPEMTLVMIAALTWTDTDDSMISDFKSKEVEIYHGLERGEKQISVSSPVLTRISGIVDSKVWEIWVRNWHIHSVIVSI